MLQKNERSGGKEYFDVAIIGGGPAGIMAAIVASERGKRVVIIEKNGSLGKKLLITGKGRANITQAEFSKKEFIGKLGKNGKFLFSSLNLFGPLEVIEFFNRNGVKTKVERGKRVFPVLDDSKEVLNCLVRNLKKNSVSLILGEKVLGFSFEKNQIKSVKLKDREIVADSFVLATGGKSYPKTGSTGEGYVFAKNLGHKIVDLSPALTPLKTKEDWPKELQGLSLKNVKINVFQFGKKIGERFGEMIFTHFGLSGPIILDVSRDLIDFLSKGELELELDLKPALSFPKLDERLKRDFLENRNKDFINYLPDLLPQKMIDFVISRSGIPARKKIGQISKEERKSRVSSFKNLTQRVLNSSFKILPKGFLNLN